MNTGILLTGGKGLRLNPQSIFVNKHFNIVYDKPVFFYSLTSLILTGIDKLIISCNQADEKIFSFYVKYLKKIGLPSEMVLQPSAGGIPTAIQVCENKVDKNSKITVMLGDNVIVGNELTSFIKLKNNNNAVCYLKKVLNLKKFGIARFSKDNKIVDFIEKPKKIYPEDKAVIGLYQFPYSVFEIIRTIKPSQRGETEIVDVLRYYNNKKKLNYFEFGRGVYWSDVGSHNSILESSNFIKGLQKNSGRIIGMPEEAMLFLGKIKKPKQFKEIKNFYKDNKNYTNYLNMIKQK